MSSQRGCPAKLWHQERGHLVAPGQHKGTADATAISVLPGGSESPRRPWATSFLSLGLSRWFYKMKVLILFPPGILLLHSPAAGLPSPRPPTGSKLGLPSRTSLCPELVPCRIPGDTCLSNPGSRARFKESS